MQAQEIERRLRKTGDSLFEFETLEVTVSGDVFLPVASLNAIRRDALAALEEKILESAAKPESGTGASSGAFMGGAERSGIFTEHGEINTEGGIDRRRPEIWAQVTTAEQLRAAQRCGIENIIVEETPQIMEILSEAERAQCLIALPHVCRTSSRNRVRKLAGMGFRGVLARNPEEIDILRQIRYEGLVVGDGSLYQWNTAARDLLLEHCDKLSLGWELSYKDMIPLMKGAANRQLLQVYGRIPMMITAGCVKKTTGKCSRAEQGFFAIEDRKGMRFPVRCVCGHCSNVIYNSLPLSLHGFVKNADPVISGAAGWICAFTTESGAETMDILRWYITGGEDKDARSVFREYTTGHYRKSAL